MGYAKWQGEKGSHALVDVNWSQIELPGSGNTLELDLSPPALKVVANRKQQQG